MPRFSRSRHIIRALRLTGLRATYQVRALRCRLHRGIGPDPTDRFGATSSELQTSRMGRKLLSQISTARRDAGATCRG